MSTIDQQSKCLDTLLQKCMENLCQPWFHQAYAKEIHYFKTILPTLAEVTLQENPSQFIGQPNLIAKEMKGQRKDGTIFHINLSINEGKVGGKTFCSAFIRDTEM